MVPVLFTFFVILLFSILAFRLLRTSCMMLVINKTNMLMQ